MIEGISMMAKPYSPSTRHASDYQAIDSVLRRRGHVILGEGQPSDLCKGAKHFLFNERQELLHALDSKTFRKVLRKLAATGAEGVALETLRGSAGESTPDHIDRLVSTGIAEVGDGEQVRMVAGIDNIGPMLEWYVAELCTRELHGSAAWSVELDQIRYGGDFDVLAWLDPTLVYVELKSSAPQQVSDGEIKHFLQRGLELAPDLAILLIDTENGLQQFSNRVCELMLPAICSASGITDPDWLPEEPFIQPQAGFDGVFYGHRRYYITNSEPTMLTQIRRCLRHYNARVKGTSTLGGAPLDFVSGTVLSAD